MPFFLVGMWKSQKNSTNYMLQFFPKRHADCLIDL